MDYNPNSSLAIRNLSSIYRRSSRDLEKYLEYALMAINIDIPLSDTVRTEGIEYDYYRLGAGFRYCGFLKEALMYVNQSLEINPDYTPAQT